MIKYVVHDNYSDIGEFGSYEEALEYANEYINITVPYLASVFETCGITNVWIEKETFEKKAKNVYKFITSEEVFSKCLI